MKQLVTRAVSTLALIGAVACGGGGGDGQEGGSAEFWTIRNVVAVPGMINSMVVDSKGKFAYLSNGSGVIVFDVVEERATRIFASPDQFFSVVDDVDPTDTLVSLHSFETAGVMDVRTGEVVRILNGGSFGRTTFAAGKLYAPAFNDRVVYAAALDGSSQATIFPYADDRVAGPRDAVHTPSGATVVFVDEFTNGIHAIDTATDAVTDTYIVGFAAEALFAAGEEEVIAVAGSRIAFVDLTDPTLVPHLLDVDGLTGVSSFALSSAGTRLVSVSRRQVENTEEDPFLEPFERSQPEIGLVDLRSGVLAHSLLIEEAETPSIFRFPVVVTPDGATVLLAAGDRVYVLSPAEPL